MQAITAQKIAVLVLKNEFHENNINSWNELVSTGVEPLTSILYSCKKHSYLQCKIRK